MEKLLYQGKFNEIRYFGVKIGYVDKKKRPQLRSFIQFGHLSACSFFPRLSLARLTGTGLGQPFEPGESAHCVRDRRTAHLHGWLQAHTNGRPPRQAEQPAVIVGPQIDTSRACRFAFRHAGDGAGNRGSDTTGTASGSANHGVPLSDVYTG